MSLQYWPLGFSDSPSYAAPLTPWASFPAALTVEGQIRRLAELPHVSLIALGGIWRPLGGRQVLQFRHNNPVTVQSLTEQRADTLGPFPGGLVRAGMRLRLDFAFRLPAIGGSIRRAHYTVGSAGHVYNSAQQIGTAHTSTSGLDVSGWLDTYLNVLSDVSAAHRGPARFNLSGLGLLSSGVISTADIGSSPTVDFSQPWDMGLWGVSAAETATNITSVSWSGGVAIFVNPSHTLNTGDKTTVAGVSVGGYNGVYSNITRIDANTWSGTLVADPGGAGTGGTSSRISAVEFRSYSLALEG